MCDGGVHSALIRPNYYTAALTGQIGSEFRIYHVTFCYLTVVDECNAYRVSHNGPELLDQVKR